jgi:colanic acid biosynthesis glycosyl transferase WcaI
MQAPNVLVVTPQFAPDFGPSAPIYTWLAEDLQRMGCQVCVVTAFPHYAGAGDRYRLSGRLFTSESVNGIRIIRAYVYSVPKGALWARLVYHASFNIFSTLAAFKVKTPDVVLADAPTLWSGLPLTIKAILPGTPFIYIMHDIYPDVLTQLGYIKNPKLIEIIERIEEYFYNKSAHISVLSEGFRENLLRKGVPEDKIAVIPICVDTDVIRPLPRMNELRTRWGLRDEFVVLYAGNIGLSQGLDFIIDAARQLINYPDVIFILVGEGATKAALQEKAQQANLRNRVRFYPFLPREQVPMLYAISDVCLVSLKKDIVVESVPSKTYTILASGRPIIAAVDPNTEVSRLIDTAQCGLCVQAENPAALAEAILQLYKDPGLRTHMGNRGREFVVKHNSREVAAENYYKLINNVVNALHQ